MKFWLIRNNRVRTDNPRTRPSVLLKLYSVMPDYPARLRVYSLVRESQTCTFLCYVLPWWRRKNSNYVGGLSVLPFDLIIV